MSSESSHPPGAPQSRTSDLPSAELDEIPSFDRLKPDYLDNPEFAHLTPSQVYEMNQNLLDESMHGDGPSRPLIDKLAPMSVLRDEYVNGSPSFVKQIDFLSKQGFNRIRRAKGDGDCFYRSLAFAFVENLLQSSNSQAVSSALAHLNSTLDMLKAAGFDALAYDDFYDTFVSIIKNIDQHNSHGTVLTEDALLEAFQSAEISNSVVMYLRLLTSAQIRTDPESFEAFLFHPELGEMMDTRSFCETFVDPVGKEADHVQITALSKALNTSVNIAYLDGRSADGHVDFVSFSNEAKGPQLNLLYRPGHYDILVKA